MTTSPHPIHHPPHPSRAVGRLLGPILLGALALAVCAHAQTTTTVPVGIVNRTIPAGSTALPSYTPVSLPLYRNPVASATIGSVDGATQLSLSELAMTPGEFAQTASPHLVKVTSGGAVGRFFLITANTESQLTVSLAQTPTVTTLLGVLSAGDRVSIIPANTLASVFGTSPALLVSGPSASTADNVFLLEGPGLGWKTFFHNGTGWRQAGALGEHDHTVIYPDEGVLVVHIGASPVSLMIAGVVPSTTETSDLSGTGSTFAAHRVPLDVELSSIGFHSTAGWKSGVTTSTADNVWAWNSSLKKWEQFYYNGTNWRKAGSLSNQNGRIVAAGESLIVTRIGTTSNATLTYSLPYVP